MNVCGLAGLFIASVNASRSLGGKESNSSLMLQSGPRTGASADRASIKPIIYPQLSAVVPRSTELNDSLGQHLNCSDLIGVEIKSKRCSTDNCCTKQRSKSR
jgi:hypothetical protein